MDFLPFIQLGFFYRFPSRVRSASTRSGELSTGSLLTQSQQKILGVGAKYDASTGGFQLEFVCKDCFETNVPL